MEQAKCTKHTVTKAAIFLLASVADLALPVGTKWAAVVVAVVELAKQQHVQYC